MDPICESKSICDQDLKGICKKRTSDETASTTFSRCSKETVESNYSASDSADVDIALKYLRNASDELLEQDSISLGFPQTAILSPQSQLLMGLQDLSPKVLKKIDLVILPFLCCTYLLMFLDKVLLNYAAVMGIKKNLRGNEFSNLSTIFSASYIFMEPIVTYLLQRYAISKVLGSFITCWGVVIACHSVCKTYTSLMVARTLLGIFESSSAVGCIAISGMYYTKGEQSARIGFWATQAGTGYIIGGLMSFGFQHYCGKHFASWQIMFLMMGLITVAFGICVFFYLPDNVTNAWFLSKREKIQVIEHIKGNQTGLENKKFKVDHIKELFLQDKLTWPMLLLTGCSQVSTGAIGTFSTTITATFGFNNYVTALLQLPIGAIVALIIIITTQLMARWGHITLITTSMFIPAICGCIVMLSLPLSNKVGNLLALYLVYSGSCVITNIYIWNSWNTSGYCKRLSRNAATMVIYMVSCIVAPQMFRASSAPEYRPAKIALLVTQCACIPLQLYVGYLSKKENTKRNKEQRNEGHQDYEFLDLTDIQNRNFRYIY